MFAQILQDFIQIFQYIPFSILCSLPITGGLYFYFTIGAFLGYIIYYIFINRHVPKKLRPVFTILVILWMAFIFSFSMENGSRSENTSSGVAQLIARIFISDFDAKPPKEQKEVLNRLSYPIRKCGHITEYAILGFLVYVMFYAYGFEGRRRFLLAVLLAVFYAASDEFHQVFVPGRSGRFTDVLIDSIGILIGNGIAKVCLRK